METKFILQDIGISKTNSIQETTMIFLKQCIKTFLCKLVLTQQGVIEYFHTKVINNFNEFKQNANVIIANRMTPDLEDLILKIYTRDLFGKD